MKLFEVTNGYMGNDYVHCDVIAENEERAIELARDIFKENAKVKNYRTGEWNKKYRYPKRYWENLEADCICEDTSKEEILGLSE